MFYEFLVSGFVPERRDGWIALGEFKSQASRAAESLSDCNERFGPPFGFERDGGWAYQRSMTKHELAFGVYTAPSIKFDGLVRWAGHEGLGWLPEVKVNLELCRRKGVSADEILDFVRRIIEAAGWTIVSEEPAESARRQMAGVD